MISIAAAVLPWIPKATALLPPWRKTIAASPIGMIAAASINQLSLHVLAYNLKRVIEILGVGPLLQAMRA